MGTPSQHISSVKIDEEYDKLHAENEKLKLKHSQLISGLEEITHENSNFGTYNYIQKLCRLAAHE